MKEVISLIKKSQNNLLVLILILISFLIFIGCSKKEVLTNKQDMVSQVAPEICVWKIYADFLLNSSIFLIKFMRNLWIYIQIIPFSSPPF